MSTEVGTLVIDISARLARLEAGVKEGAAVVKKGMDEIQSAANLAKNALFALGGVVGVSSFAGFIKSQIDLGDSLSKMAQKTGLSVESLSSYQFAAKLSGVGNDELNTSLRKLASSMQDAAINKGSEVARTLRALGVSTVDASGKLRSTGAVFEDLSKSFAGTKDGAGKTAAAVTLLGRSGSELIPLMNGLGELTEEAKRTGAIVSTEFAKDSEAFKDSVERLQSGVGALARTIAGPLVAGLNDAIESLNVFAGIQDKVGANVLRRELKTLEDQLVSTATVFDFFSGKMISARVGMFGSAITDDQVVRLKARVAEIKAALAELEKPGAGAPDRKKDFPKITSGVEEAAALAAAARLEVAKKAAESEYWLYQGMLENKLTALDQYLATDREKEDAAFAERLGALQAANNFRLIENDEYLGMERELIAQHQAKVTEIEDAALRKRSGAQTIYHQVDKASMGFFFGEMANLMQTENRKQFAIGKMAAIAQTAIRTHSAAMGAYEALSSIYLVGPALGAAAAAAVILYGAAQMNAIRNTQFGGGGTAGGAVPTFSASPNTGLPTRSPGGGDSQPGGTMLTSGTTYINLYLQGRRQINVEDLDELIDQINQRQRDGNRVEVGVYA